MERKNKAMHFVASNEDGNSISMDGSPEIGGENLGVRPMQLMLMGIAGCSSIDLVLFLKKMRQPLEDIKVSVSATRREGEVPSLFETITVDYQLFGDLSEAKAEKAIKMSLDQYCSVAKIIEHSAEIKYTFSINPVI